MSFLSFKEGEEESSELEITLDEDGRVCSQEGPETSLEALNMATFLLRTSSKRWISSSFVYLFMHIYALFMVFV